MTSSFGAIIQLKVDDMQENALFYHYLALMNGLAGVFLTIKAYGSSLVVVEYQAFQSDLLLGWLGIGLQLMNFKLHN